MVKEHTDYQKAGHRTFVFTHGSRGIGATVESSMSALPTATGVNTRPPSMDDREKRTKRENERDDNGGHWYRKEVSQSLREGSSSGKVVCVEVVGTEEWQSIYKGKKKGVDYLP